MFGVVGGRVLPGGEAHGVGCAWGGGAALAERLVVGVVREPLLRYLGGDRSRYSGYAEAGVTIEFAEPP
ncbi:MAG: hypothetical protein NVSMB21_07030 [Vulcanimicrobiaceae bacterium]